MGVFYRAFFTVNLLTSIWLLKNMDIIHMILTLFGFILFAHLVTILIYTFVINPFEYSRKRKLFPYQFLYNLYISKYKLDKPYFSIRVDINSSKSEVKKSNPGLVKLIKIANRNNIPITFSIATEYLSVLSKEVVDLIKKGDHEVATHCHYHSDITQREQYSEIKYSKRALEKKFNQRIIGMVAPHGRQNLDTLYAANKNGIKYVSSGMLPYLKYQPFPYPFIKKNIWLLGGGGMSDVKIYRVRDYDTRRALKTWKRFIYFRYNKGWYTQLEYHSFFTSEDQLKVLEKLFKFINDIDDLLVITNGDLVKILENKKKMGK